MSIVFICRRCIKFFVLNNKFHNHIRNFECFDFNIQLKIFFSNQQLNFFKKIEIDVIDFHVVIIFTIKITKKFELNFNYDSISIVSSNVDFSKNIEIDCEYRDWNYAKIEIVLFEKIESKFVYIDIESKIIIANRRFFFVKILICLFVLWLHFYCTKNNHWLTSNFWIRHCFDVFFWSKK